MYSPVSCGAACATLRQTDGAHSQRWRRAAQAPRFRVPSRVHGKVPYLGLARAAAQYLRLFYVAAVAAYRSNSCSSRHRRAASPASSVYLQYVLAVSRPTIAVGVELVERREHSKELVTSLATFRAKLEDLCHSRCHSFVGPRQLCG